MVSPTAVALILGSYLLGSVSFAAIVASKARGIDLRSVGSGNLGATNVGRTLGKSWGLLVYVLDLLKGLLPVLLAEAFFETEWAFGTIPVPVLCAAAALLGHCFPIFYGFRGGKGVATASGIILAHSAFTLLAVLASFVVGLLASRMVSVGSMLGAVVLPVAYLAIERRHALEMPNLAWLTLYLLMGILVIVLHRSNIQRIVEGTEHRIGGKKP
ncbi:MAG TPA: glycerol-3-phosphate 1-O-acyltransferase PlsY [Planctomycetota bacterium]|nr:glycerol-3-phosphate 1-O-acyltransferase PlsY [Planctomycetota bacterium]